MQEDSYQCTDDSFKQVESLEPPADVLPVSVYLHTGLGGPPRQEVVVVAVKHCISRLGA
ncbi:hypothetical protein DPMN_167853 [Dreissena polymorpha]|uniref:Uncharacterized protein n=1 Tax=Dreissena polymorpha TaxID=45954 RepID=A0A9D4IZ02_DREPO|nr:hypothetical protein DPMN_167853 [Dreissena polymorpha]